MRGGLAGWEYRTLHEEDGRARLWSGLFEPSHDAKVPRVLATGVTSVNGALPTPGQRHTGSGKSHESVKKPSPCIGQPPAERRTGTPHCLVNGQADAPSWRTRAGPVSH